MMSRTVLLLAAAMSVASAATFNSLSSASGGTSFNGLNSRDGFSRPSGGSSFISSTSVNGRPAGFTSSTSGTGQNRFSTGFGSTLGSRGAFAAAPFRPIRIPQIRPIQVPQIQPIQIPQIQPFVGYPGQNRYYNSYGTGVGLGSRFGGSSRYPSNRFGSTSLNAGAATGLDVNGYFNRLANAINRDFAANLGR